LNHPEIFPWLAVGWLGYGLLSFYFLFSRDAARKRRLWPPYTIGGGVLFLGVMLAMGFPLVMIAIMAPIIALMTWHNTRRGMVFCDQCGATIWSMVPFAKPRHCSNCGAPINPPAS
jgi:hypothetical protein